ncbi:MAG TPA: glycosyltransferase family 1 protein [Burkholderiales bacterium]|nr:glycosyltransferase family 1 protein [Burkholderiales bacterium]
MRIAFVTETYPPEINGVSLSVARVIEKLRARNHEIQLVRPRQDGDAVSARRSAAEEVLVRGFPLPRYPGLRFGLPAGRTLLDLWSRARPDLVHIVTEGPLGWSALKAATQLKVPVTSDFRTNFHVYSRHYGLGWLQHAVTTYLRRFHNSTLVTMVPTAQQQRTLSNAGFESLVVVARGVDTVLFQPARRDHELRRSWGAGPDDAVVMHVGRLAPEKNLPLLFDAFAAIRQRCPGARFVMVGDGPSRPALRRQYPEVNFTGTRRGEELAAHYASGDLFLFPSMTETFGNVTLEAMASGLAVVAYNYAAAAAHIKHCQNGFLAAYGDADEFSRFAAEAVTHMKALRRMRAAARFTAQTLDWDRIVADLEALFFSVTEAALVCKGMNATRTDRAPA